jgi:hypothetical protein
MKQSRMDFNGTVSQMASPYTGKQVHIPEKAQQE